MTNAGMIFFDNYTEWLLEAVFFQYQFQISIYCKYELDGTNIVVLSHVDHFF